MLRDRKSSESIEEKRRASMAFICEGDGCGAVIALVHRTPAGKLLCSACYSAMRDRQAEVRDAGIAAAQDEADRIAARAVAASKARDAMVSELADRGAARAERERVQRQLREEGITGYGG
jgi:hypothetical protein